MKKTTTIRTMARRLTEAVPAEWTVTRGKGYSDGFESWADMKGEWIRFERDGIAVVLNVALPESSWDRQSSFEGIVVEGHTTFDGRCFTRRGVDTCSCRLSSRDSYDHVYGSVVDLLAGEFARCVAARERSKTAVPVPGLPFNVQPEWFGTAAETLRAGRVVRLTPGGFGTGYTLARRRSTYAKRASAELETRLDVGPVFVETFDHD